MPSRIILPDRNLLSVSFSLCSKPLFFADRRFHDDVHASVGGYTTTGLYFSDTCLNSNIPTV